jgi:hypothetical protein
MRITISIILILTCCSIDSDLQAGLVDQWEFSDNDGIALSPIGSAIGDLLDGAKLIDLQSSVNHSIRVESLGDSLMAGITTKF